MNEISEVRRYDAPCSRPQALAFDGTHLWVGSIDTQRLYALDPQTWRVAEEIALPSKPWGMVAVDGSLQVVCGEGEADDRVIRPVRPGAGLAEGGIPCPEATGSQLSYDGARLYLSQWYQQRILTLDEQGGVEAVLALPHQICGQTFVDGRFYCITTDDENSHQYFLTRVDPRAPGGPRIEDLARIAFDARALAFDGTWFWTNHREAHQTVAFARPD